MSHSSHTSPSPPQLLQTSPAAKMCEGVLNYACGSYAVIGNGSNLKITVCSMVEADLALLKKWQQDEKWTRSVDEPEPLLIPGYKPKCTSMQWRLCPACSASGAINPRWHCEPFMKY